MGYWRRLHVNIDTPGSCMFTDLFAVRTRLTGVQDAVPSHGSWPAGAFLPIAHKADFQELFSSTLQIRAMLKYFVYLTLGDIELPQTDVLRTFGVRFNFLVTNVATELQTNRLESPQTLHDH